MPLCRGHASGATSGEPAASGFRAAIDRAVAEVAAAEASTFEMEVTALDMNLHFVEVDEAQAELQALQVCQRHSNRSQCCLLQTQPQ